MFRYGFNSRLFCVQVFFYTAAYFSFNQGWWYFSIVFVGFAVGLTKILNHAHAPSPDYEFPVEASFAEVEPTQRRRYSIAEPSPDEPVPYRIKSDSQVSGYWSTDEALPEEEITRIQSAVSKLQDTIQIGIKSDDEMMDKPKQEKAYRSLGVNPRHQPELPATIESFISNLSYDCPDGFHDSLARMGISRCKYCGADIDISWS